MSNPLNIPPTITADALLRAGLTQAEIAAVSDVVTPAQAEAPAATDAAPAPAAEAPAPAPKAADMGYDADQMPGTDGSDGETVVVDAENDLGEGDGLVIREYDPVRDAEPEAKTEPETETPAEPEAEPDADLSALLDLKRPELPPQVASTAAEQADVRKQLSDLRTTFLDGEMTQDEFDQQQEALTDKLADLRATERVAAQAVQPDMEAFREGWFKLVDQHMNANPVLRDDPEVMEGFDAILKQVTADPQLRTLPAVDQIEIAHRRLADAYLVARREPMAPLVSLRNRTAAPAKPAQPQQQAPAKPTGPRTDPRPEAPVTLAGISGAQAEGGITGDPVIAEVRAIINSGNTTAAEAALARLSPAQREALYRS